VAMLFISPSVLFHYYDVQMNGSKMSSSCCVHGGGEKCVQILVEWPDDKGPLRRSRRKIILKWIIG
jgi:hypothetical protein